MFNIFNYCCLVHWPGTSTVLSCFPLEIKVDTILMFLIG